MSTPSNRVEDTYNELLIGCGNARAKIMGKPGDPKFQNLTTLDMDPNCGADVVHDLNVFPWPIESESMDEIHAYQILEHLGQQGDHASYFAMFSEIYRILKPSGLLFAMCPSPKSEWLWGDPGHRRMISMQSVTFLIQPEYEKQIGVTSMTDYRHLYKADFNTLLLNDDTRDLRIVLQAVKPSRCRRN